MVARGGLVSTLVVLLSGVLGAGLAVGISSYVYSSRLANAESHNRSIDRELKRIRRDLAWSDRVRGAGFDPDAVGAANSSDAPTEDSAAEPSAGVPGAAASAPPDPELEESPEERATRLDEARRLWLEHLEREAWDPAWAPAAEQRIVSELERVHYAGKTGTHLLDAECRTTLCMVRVGHDARTDQLGFMGQLTFAEMPRQFGMVENKEGQLTTLLFLVREGHREPI